MAQDQSATPLAVHAQTRTAARALAPVGASPPTPAEMLQTAIQTGANVEVLAKLMELQERWEATQARKAFDSAIASAKAEIPVIRKNRQVGFESKRTGDRTAYSFADLGEITRVVVPILSAHGLLHRFRTEQSAGAVRVTCILSHKDGHAEETTLEAPPDTSGSKNSIQAVASTQTFLSRYTLIAALGLASTEDDDGRGGGGDQKQLDEAQVAEIEKLVADLGVPRDRVLAFLRIENFSDIWADKFEEVKGVIRRKAAATKAKDETNG